MYTNNKVFHAQVYIVSSILIGITPFLIIHLISWVLKRDDFQTEELKKFSFEIFFGNIALALVMWYFLPALVKWRLPYGLALTAANKTYFYFYFLFVGFLPVWCIICSVVYLILEGMTFPVPVRKNKNELPKWVGWIAIIQFFVHLILWCTLLVSMVKIGYFKKPLQLNNLVVQTCTIQIEKAELHYQLPDHYHVPSKFALEPPQYTRLQMRGALEDFADAFYSWLALSAEEKRLPENRRAFARAARILNKIIRRDQARFFREALTVV